jgi:hypothetical protein
MGSECWAAKRFDECAELIRDTVDPSDMRGVPYIGLEHIAEANWHWPGMAQPNKLQASSRGFGKGYTFRKA